MNLSDWRTKCNIIAVGRIENGIGLYRFRYLWSDQVFVGVLAQEVVKIVPRAVERSSDGYMWVNYSRLGLRLRTWEEWISAKAYLEPTFPRGRLAVKRGARS
jgi:hypothetical protein